MTEPERPDEDLRYSAAAAELEAILDEIESGAVDVDVLAEKVGRAARLIELCQKKLAGSELEVTKILEDLEVGARGEAGGGCDGEA